MSNPVETEAAKITTERLEFRGGAGVSVIPLAVFIVATMGLVISGAPDVNGMIIAAMVGISAGMFFSRDFAAYSEKVFSLMANRIATVAVVAWLWAGAFSGILADSGLVEAIVWIGTKLHLSGAFFTVAVFISAAFFAVSVGTGMGTIVGFTAVIYPAGIVLGSNPAALLGAIFSGAAFGDNLAPISDTTIVSAATQETDIGGVVRSRLKYVLIAGGISAVLFLIFGGGGSAIDPAEAEKLMTETADPTGLPMLIPAAIVFFVAVSGRHFLAALTAGAISALIVGPLFGVFPLSRVLYIAADGSVAGSAVSGATALLPISILTLLLVTAIGIMSDAGFMDKLMAWLDRNIARSVRGAEAAIVALISFANICVSVNTVAMITTGPLANELRKRHKIHPYRSANLLDTISCSFPYILPYSATIVAANAIQKELVERYSFAVVVPWTQEAPYIFYGIVLFPLMIAAVATGFGRKKG
ncbi:MAG: Na+/H+ antiporter NhaC family protein [Candidatus Latescibacteria bacterium]|nr:Na+/H+ antiporter NhaC family protein [Candidatus Latescibacterota bacterium]